MIQPGQKNVVSPVLANLQELITEVKTGGSLGCSDHALTMKMVRVGKTLLRKLKGVEVFLNWRGEGFGNTSLQPLNI